MHPFATPCIQKAFGATVNQVDVEAMIKLLVSKTAFGGQAVQGGESLASLGYADVGMPIDSLSRENNTHTRTCMGTTRAKGQGGGEGRDEGEGKAW